MMKYQINGMVLRRDIRWQVKTPVIARAEIELPDIGAKITGVMLAFVGGKMFTAFAPALKEGIYGMRWDSTTEWAHKLGADLYKMYRVMGGEKPPGYKVNPDDPITVTTKPREVPVPIDDLAELGLSRPVDLGLARTLGLAS